MYVPMYDAFMYVGTYVGTNVWCIYVCTYVCTNVWCMYHIGSCYTKIMNLSLHTYICDKRHVHTYLIGQRLRVCGLFHWNVRVLVYIHTYERAQMCPLIVYLLVEEQIGPVHAWNKEDRPSYFLKRWSRRLIETYRFEVLTVDWVCFFKEDIKKFEGTQTDFTRRVYPWVWTFPLGLKLALRYEICILGVKLAPRDKLSHLGVNILYCLEEWRCEQRIFTPRSQLHP
jgi:hypothetical protein